MTPSGVVDRDRVTAWFLQELPPLAPAWLQGQRWFGGKAETIDRVGVEDVLWLPDGAPDSALVVLDVRYTNREGAGSARRERYATVIAIDEGDHGAPVIGSLPWQPGLQAIEATSTGLGLHALLGGLRTGLSVRGVRGGEIVYADSTNRARRLLPAGHDGPLRIVPLGVEQSNTSVRVGSTHVFKLFRRLEEGDHPQLEIGRFLARVGFRAAPPLEGSMVYRLPGGRDCALGALEGWVENEGDGWSHAVRGLEREVREGTDPGDLAEHLFGLGTTTADFHAALASDPDTAAFAPEPVTETDRQTWHDHVLSQAQRTFDLIERHYRSWDPPTHALAASALGAREHVVHRVGRRGAGVPDVFQKIRIHGDFHLGQTLRTPDGFIIIDFEGEPAKPLEARRQKQCALRDVAGMLRSIEYAVATVDAQAPTPEPAPERPVGRLRDSFLGGYRSRALAQAAVFLPPTAEASDAWLAIFELEKALYEVEYEVNNRPSWVHIPLAAVGRLLTGTP